MPRTERDRYLFVIHTWNNATKCQGVYLTSAKSQHSKVVSQPLCIKMKNNTKVVKIIDTCCKMHFSASRFAQIYSILEKQVSCSRELIKPTASNCMVRFLVIKNPVFSIMATVRPFGLVSIQFFVYLWQRKGKPGREQSIEHRFLRSAQR